MAKELKYLQLFAHEYVIKYYPEISAPFTIYMEYASLGSLHCGGKLEYKTPQVYRLIAKQLLTALAYINSKGYIFGDLKGSNIALFPSQVKVCLISVLFLL